ncbi:MAM and LDL-receptor class A domain-containing protein 1-like [Penaeus japonicus]|uniref:MAM and LDL-receptor class A domain-containing protein 1-like n=1 Tax=Penaeus japonicus TaxID=27405 RepID=UPI001C713621|nr:MAM and LDL-receptor class A domain-containing protein 1-like [Penaeus japonicus]XP_042868708.1 MAM and LDL-receptor class A domain-containing protein 1-like [Penaeus japonicus]XP_042868709.1 MAM and LDL-receptor class A domain-containing protein 1-like [Penaeus japonicus]
MSESVISTERKMTLVVFFAFAFAFGGPPVNAQADCSFNATGTSVSLCSLLKNNEAFSVAAWKGGTGAESNWSGGPPVDNGNDPAGGFGVATTYDMVNTDQPYKKAWLVTEPSPKTGALGKCLEFAYAIYGLGIEEFQVFLMTYLTEDVNDALQNNTSPVVFQRTTLMRRKSTTHGQWTPAKISFSAKGDFSVAFEALPDAMYERYTGYVAVDDITFRPGSCENECTFDFNFCDLTNEPNNDDFDWSLGRGTEKMNTGPTKDQSSFISNGITNGGYAYISSGYPRTDGDIAQLVSPVLDPTESPMCLKFWLNMYGSGIGAMRVLYSPTANANNIRELWKQEGSSSGTDDWYPSQVTVSSTESFNLIFEASVGRRGSGDIALDSITYSMGACPSQPAFSTSNWGDCTFMENTCGWQIPYFPDEVCSMLSRVTESNENPPGHTENDFDISDSYIQFDLSCYQQQARYTVSLTYLQASITTESCLSFWVYMFTRVQSQSKIGALSVILITSDGNQTLWRLENEQHSDWVYAQVTLPAVGLANVAFQTTKASSVIGMIGVDDVTVFSSACEVLPEQSRYETGDCSFDHDFCAWTVQNEDPLATRPSENWRHATRDVGAVAGLRDHTFQADGGGCLPGRLQHRHRQLVEEPKRPREERYVLSLLLLAALFPDSGRAHGGQRPRQHEGAAVASARQRHSLRGEPVVQGPGRAGGGRGRVHGKHTRQRGLTRLLWHRLWLYFSFSFTLALAFAVLFEALLVFFFFFFFFFCKS